MKKTPPFEKEHATLVEALRRTRLKGPDERFADGVIDRIDAEHGVRSELESSQPEGGNVASRVMVRIRGDGTSRAPSRKHGRRAPRWFLPLGGAIAAGLAIAVLFTPMRDWLRDSGAQVVPNDPAPPSALQPASPMPSGQIRSVRDFGGERCYVIDAGLVEGLRVGDVLAWERDGQRAGQLRVIGVSAYAAITRQEGRSEREPQPRDHVEPLFLTDVMRRAAKEIESGSQARGAFYGLGIMLARGSEGVVVMDVVRELWRPEDSAPEPSRASRLGLEVGDVIRAALGERVASEADLERILLRVDPDATVLTMTVLRDGHELALTER